MMTCLIRLLEEPGIFFDTSFSNFLKPFSFSRKQLKVTYNIFVTIFFLRSRDDWNMYASRTYMDWAAGDLAENGFFLLLQISDFNARSVCVYVLCLHLRYSWQRQLQMLLLLLLLLLWRKEKFSIIRSMRACGWNLYPMVVVVVVVEVYNSNWMMSYLPVCIFVWL